MVIREYIIAGRRGERTGPLWAIDMCAFGLVSVSVCVLFCEWVLKFSKYARMFTMYMYTCVCGVLCDK